MCWFLNYWERLWLTSARDNRYVSVLLLLAFCCGMHSACVGVLVMTVGGGNPKKQRGLVESSSVAWDTQCEMATFGLPHHQRAPCFPPGPLWHLWADSMDVHLFSVVLCATGTRTAPRISISGKDVKNVPKPAWGSHGSPIPHSRGIRSTLGRHC